MRECYDLPTEIVGFAWHGGGEPIVIYRADGVVFGVWQPTVLPSLTRSGIVEEEITADIQAMIEHADAEIGRDLAAGVG